MSAVAHALFIGIGGHVAAIDPTTGAELWRTKLAVGGGFVSVTTHGPYLVAAHSGELYCLDREDGRILWHNTLKGLGVGFITFAGNDASSAASAQEAQGIAIASAISSSAG